MSQGSRKVPLPATSTSPMLFSASRRVSIKSASAEAIISSVVWSSNVYPQMVQGIQASFSDQVITFAESPDLGHVPTDGSYLIYLTDQSTGQRIVGTIAEKTLNTVTLGGISNGTLTNTDGLTWAIGAQLINSDGQPEYYAVDTSMHQLPGAWILDENGDPLVHGDISGNGAKTNGFDIQTISAAGLEDLPADESSLVVVAVISEELHFRVFDETGLYKDYAQGDLSSNQEDALNSFKQRIDPLVDQGPIQSNLKKLVLDDAVELLDLTIGQDPGTVITLPEDTDLSGVLPEISELQLTIGDEVTSAIISDVDPETIR